MKTIRELYNEIMADKELQEKCRKATDAGKLEEFLKEHGCEATMEEVEAFLKARTQEDAPLSMDELDEAAGGGNREFPFGKYLSETKFRCPKCGSCNVRNFDPGWFWVVRIECNDCGYYGERGSKSETSI